mgnify:CR=1 FL=1
MKHPTASKPCSPRLPKAWGQIVSVQLPNDWVFAALALAEGQGRDGMLLALYLALGAAELRGILRVVEDCERPPTLAAFREAALDALVAEAAKAGSSDTASSSASPSPAAS